MSLTHTEAHTHTHTHTHIHTCTHIHIHRSTHSVASSPLQHQFKSKTPTSCPPDPGQSPLAHHALVFQYSNVAHDSLLCDNVYCEHNKNAEYNYTTMETQGYAVDAGTTGAIPLVQYFSKAVHDNYVTTNTTAPQGYGLVKKAMTAYILKSAPADLAPERVVKLQVWYNARLGDHLTAANAERIAWAQANGYEHMADLGYLYAEPTSMSMAAMEHDL
eukprot:TRINITY_DN12279_c0_g2_i1.p1 TRINITY_DN12279_c0_g2~~TRINITY_DN12279_c0_g2_i1.p1  ORF type:complete len:217 (+),score=44.53 TRINITY_DN12279_c0_g2_i1:96-746(+)